MSIQVPVDSERIDRFCGRWDVVDFSLFGSVLTNDYGADSDIDVLLTFGKDAGWSLWDLVEMKSELENLFGRKVDLVTRRSVEQSHNWIRREGILSSAQSIHAEG